MPHTYKSLASAPLTLGLAVALLFPGTASASGIGRCTQDVDTYRSLVVHRQDDNDREITLPDLSSFELSDDQAIIDTNFWEDPFDEFAGFSIKRTLRNLVITDPLVPQDISESEIEARMDGLAQSWLDSISPTTSHLPTGEGLSFELDGRPGVSGMEVSDFYELQPVALFNRVDARDSLGLTCGEHRIVYQIGSGSLQKLLLIFEARIQNPHPERGQDGCLPIAKHWAEAGDLDEVELADHLEALYYDGISGFEPAIHFAHLGAPFGQVRGNCFLEPVWQLREWHVGNESDPLSEDFGSPVFEVETVKGTALAELYMTEDREGIPSNVLGSPTTWAIYLDDFQQDYQNNTMPSVLAPEIQSVSPEGDGGVGFVAAMSAPTDSRYYEFQATSHFGGEIIPALVSDELASRLSCWLDGAAGTACSSIPPAPQTANITVDHIIERTKRAGTCDGCHKVGSNAEVAPGLFWPQDRGFVHVTTEGGLSDALHGTFLPPRKEGLVSMLQNAPVGDANLDGTVNVADLLSILMTFGTANDEFDQDCDGHIGALDLLSVISHFDETPESRTSGGDDLAEAALRWQEADDRQRAGILDRILVERERLRDIESAEMGPTGNPRRAH